MNKIIVLLPNDGDHQEWQICDESEIPEYTEYMREGDNPIIFVWPAKIEKTVIGKPLVTLEPCDVDKI